MLRAAEGTPTTDIHESAAQELPASITTDSCELKLDLIHFIRKPLEVCFIGTWKSLQNHIEVSTARN
jgi:hypothetical protein